MPGGPLFCLLLRHSDMALGVLDRTLDPEALRLHLWQRRQACVGRSVVQAEFKGARSNQLQTYDQIQTVTSGAVLIPQSDSMMQHLNDRTRSPLVVFRKVFLRRWEPGCFWATCAPRWRARRCGGALMADPDLGAEEAWRQRGQLCARCRHTRLLWVDFPWADRAHCSTSYRSGVGPALRWAVAACPDPARRRDAGATGSRNAARRGRKPLARQSLHALCV